jgi:hypothetical protein
MSESQDIAAEIAEIQNGGALGRSELIRRLFDYLARRTLDERAPKEAEVGADVFGREPSFDTTQDAVVRVYVHKLRRKLDAIYAGPRRDSPARLNIPRGEYRLVLEAAEPVLPVKQPSTRRLPRFAGLAAILLLMAGVSAATYLILQARLPPAVRQALQLRRGGVWGPLLADQLPTLVVMGDYYIFGESDDGMNVARLVREYTVNSASDLNGFLVGHPALSARYVDLDLRYLPVGASAADAPRVILASALTPEMIRANNIIYVGYLSGLGPLRGTVFAGSRFSVGDTYDQLVDSRTRHRYTSGGGGPESDGQVYRDFGYFSSFDGPSGGRIVIIAGTRDVGLMQMAEAATNIAGLERLTHRADAKDFEALYEVEGMDRQNVGGQLILASPIDAASKWRGAAGARGVFPAG